MTRIALCVFLLAVILAVSCAPRCAAAQMKRDAAPDTTQTSDTSHARMDTLFHMTKDPLKATLLSTFLPGAGQIYNQDYWKAPVIWAACGFFAYLFITYNNQFVHYQSLYFNSPDSTIRGSQQYFNLKESYRDARDMDGAYFFMVYVLNIADAYVSSHLFDFTVSDTKLVRGLRLDPYIGTPGANRADGAGLQLQIRLR